MPLPAGHTILGCRPCGTAVCDVFNKEPADTTTSNTSAFTRAARIEFLAQQLHHGLTPLVAQRLQGEVYDTILTWLQDAEELFLGGDVNGN